MAAAELRTVQSCQTEQAALEAEQMRRWRKLPEPNLISALLRGADLEPVRRTGLTPEDFGDETLGAVYESMLNGNREIEVLADLASGGADKQRTELVLEMCFELAEDTQRARDLAREVREKALTYQISKQHEHLAAFPDDRDAERDLDRLRALRAEAREDWPKPVSFDAVSVPGFPANALPFWVRTWAQALAEAQQVPLDLPAVLALGVGSACCAGRGVVLVKDGYREPMNNYFAAALPPGNRKSGTVCAATEPLMEFERSCEEPARRRRNRELAELEIRKDRLARLKKEASAEKDPAAGEKAADLAEEIGEDERALPVVPRLLCEETTPEALAKLLEEQGEVMALFADEGGELFEMMRGRYSQNGRANFGVYLKGWSRDAIKVDRRGRDPILMERPTLTVCVTLQPSVLQGLGDAREFKERGLLGRFLYSIPQSRLGSRDTRAPGVPSGVALEYGKRISGLLRLPRSEREIPLAPEAAEIWFGFADAIEPRLAPDVGDLAAIADWAGKLPGMVTRLAGVLHAMEWADRADPFEGGIEALAMERATQLGDYFLGHARAVFALMGADEQVEAARKVWLWIRKRGRAEFSKRDLFQQFKGGAIAQRADDLDEPLRVLVSHHYLRLAPKPGTPGRASEIYHVNPEALR